MSLEPFNAINMGGGDKAILESKINKYYTDKAHQNLVTDSTNIIIGKIKDVDNTTKLYDSSGNEIEYNTIIFDRPTSRIITLEDKSYLIFTCQILSTNKLYIVFNGGSVVINNRISINSMNNITNPTFTIKSNILINKGSEFFFNAFNNDNNSFIDIIFANSVINLGVVKFYGNCKFTTSNGKLLNLGFTKFRHSLTVEGDFLLNFGIIKFETYKTEDPNKFTTLKIAGADNSSHYVYNDYSGEIYMERDTKLIIEKNGHLINDNIFEQKENTTIIIGENGYIENNQNMKLDGTIINNSSNSEILINNINGLLTLENDFKISGNEAKIKNSDVVISYKYDPNFIKVGNNERYLNIDLMTYKKNNEPIPLLLDNQENIKDCIFELNSSNIDAADLNTITYLLNTQYNIKHQTEGTIDEILRLIKFGLLKDWSYTPKIPVQPVKPQIYLPNPKYQPDYPRFK